MVMSIHQALSELKLLDNKINKSLFGAIYIGSKKCAEKNVTQLKVSKEDFETYVSSEYQSVTDLIAYRAKIKSLIVASNAVTKVMIGGNEYTVAEAIEHKNTLNYLDRLLSEMKSQYSQVNRKVDEYNANIESSINDEIDRMNSAKQSPLQGDALAAYIKLQHDLRDYEVIDPLDLFNEIKKLEEKIMTFRNEVDYVLSTSNALTTITV